MRGFDDRVTGKLNTFAPNAKVIHMDIDPAEMNKLRQAHVALQGDLNALLPALQQTLAIDAWRQHAAEMRREHAWRYDHPGDAIFAPLLLKQLSDRKPANSVVTTDVGQHQMWSAQHMTLHAPGKLHHFKRLRHDGLRFTSRGRCPGGAPGRYGDLCLW
ncbi:Acetolactate synthase isozyme 2 large subunit [Leclercia adecarboxylata]|uniref:Acetolactate synthase isozyme 2 large subunit n=1 Tax=Leclercia adecarboxylata TaxID=83655 RepID=A0A4U9IWK7_9ENTR|nr:Acetolactate synthase isozyme 2 large subunit [Leclercia adecarboxylata]